MAFVVVAVALVAAGCASDSDDSEATPVEPEQTPLVENGAAAGEIEESPEPTDTNVAAGTSQPFPNVEQGQARLGPDRLDPGVYHTTVFGPAMTVSFGEGWIQLDEYEPLLLLSRTLAEFSSTA